MLTDQILLLDMDGTLVDTERDLAVSVNHTLVAMGHPPREQAEIKSFVGNGATALLIKALASEEPHRVEAAKQIFFQHYADHLLDHSRIFPGWESVLDADISLVVATNKPERYAKAIVKGLGLESRFDLLVGGDTLAIRKPDVGVAAFIAKQLGVSAERFVMVGDGVPDGQLAKNAGIPFWAVRWGYGSIEELSVFDPLWLDSPADVLRAVTT